MTGLDTNVLIRYLAQDDPIQSRRATEIIEQRLSIEDPGFVSLVTVVETAWVLGRVYDLSSRQVATAIERLLQADTLVLQNEQEVFTALVAVKSGRGAFADALIAPLGLWAGCQSTVTFDKKATRLDGFKLL